MRVGTDSEYVCPFLWPLIVPPLSLNDIMNIGFSRKTACVVLATSSAVDLVADMRWTQNITTKRIIEQSGVRMDTQESHFREIQSP